MQQVTTSNGSSVYEFGLNELHHVSTDDGAHKKIDNDFREARGREGARLHVMLKSISEADRRAIDSIAKLTAELQQKTQQLNEQIRAFESTADKRFVSVHDDLKQRAEALTIQINSFANAEHDHFATLKNQVATFQQTAWNQADTNFNALSTQNRESTERITFDMRKMRDELVALIDSRMNQTDASFAALRSDVEVVKFLVMDLIKDRIGRSDPKSKPY